MSNGGPAVVQSDGTILVEVEHPEYEAARDSLMRFSDLVKSPEYIHTYRLSQLSLWNAAAVGLSPSEVIDSLTRLSRYPVPQNTVAFVKDNMSKFGLLRISRESGSLVLRCSDPFVFAEITNSDKIQPFIREMRSKDSFTLDPMSRGAFKQALIRMGYPCEDLAGYVEGDPLNVSLRERTLQGKPFGLRPYQEAAVDAFWAGGSVRGGSGVVVLPCGAGKTIVGMGAIAKASTQTLILTTNVVALRQWMSELADKTTLDPGMIKEYSGEVKEIGPVTVTTYQILIHRRRQGNDEYPHFSLFSERNWGLIIYDEVHLLPAPVFRITADLQARRRLGLTATLVREDGREDEVFSLIGPKRFDKPWKELEEQNWIAQAHCHEVRVDLNPDDRLAYAVAGERDKYRIAATNRNKIDLVQEIVKRHSNDQILVIGQYLDQLDALARILKAPFLCGQTPVNEREELYSRFREGSLKILVVSKVANFSIDLPDANVAIQVSGTFGSRQEEAQRLGRILRPKPQGESATFYSLVTRNTKDQEFSQKRQLFLTEQGYKYTIWEAQSFLDATCRGAES
ncbi:MAG: DNA repair helicase XPB [Bacillota bacterium]|jgi:DNA excision repair protein ERCC-3|nr:DEAD/DEAH box helicase [Candidatus Fermentithermobacillaceae bacterium]